MTQNRGPLAFHIEFPTKTAEENDRKFQTLGFMNAHDSHTPFGGCLSGRDQALGFQSIQML